MMIFFVYNMKLCYTCSFSSGCDHRGPMCMAGTNTSSQVLPPMVY
jgi:hypothetical protein